MGISLDEVGDRRAVLISGPTASGKSAAALALAEEAERRGRRAWIVNADSMQVYDALRILTARPSPEDEARAPHRLYGHVPAATRYSTGAWLRDVGQLLAEADAAGALPIVVGGTGLYFRALTQGIAAVPDIPSEVREHWANRLEREGTPALHAILAERDPSARAIRPSDPQRILRALEVLDATGRPLSEWHAAEADALIPRGAALKVVLQPERPELYRRIEARFDDMLAEGAVDEVRALRALRLDPKLPAMKATGVRELAGYLRGEVSLEEAADAAKAETRRYAKRQTTWFRHQMPDWRRIPA
jgi:tRNA dimethylallyltransferase